MGKHDVSVFNPHFELRLKTEAEYRHLYCSIQPAESETGDECYELLAVDITDRARKEIELRESHEELTAVYENLQHQRMLSRRNWRKQIDWPIQTF